MRSSPASGERSAVRGYQRQYDRVAEKVYDALLDDELVGVRLTDPDAGKVDDLVLVVRDGVHGYQFKTAELQGTLTLGQLLAETTTRSGSPGPSLIRSLADGWQALGDKHGAAHVHLVSEHIASVHDRLGDPGGPRPSPESFAAFLHEVLLPVSDGRLALEDAPASWRHALGRLQAGAGLDDARFAGMLRSLHLELGARPPLEGASPRRRRDIISLSGSLLRLVSRSTAVVDLDRAGVLDLVGWAARPMLRSTHDFPVDGDTYSPLQAAVADLDRHLTDHPGGYVALVGPPGAGKSTLLTQALSGRPERVIRYYAFVPGATASRTRMSGTAMLHDVVVMLDRAGLPLSQRELTGEDLGSLREQFSGQLDIAGQEYAASGRRTLIVVDGLDHVERDHPGDGSLLAELPLPGELPDGVVVVVGARTVSPLHPHARQQAEERGSIVDLRDHRLSAAAVLDICRRSPTARSAEPAVHERIAELSAGHPLALSYLLNRLRDDSGRRPEDVLAGAPPYAGDVAQDYRAAWDAIEDDESLLSLLAVIARLRVGFSTDWLRSWAGVEATRKWGRSLRYLFRPAHDGWRFFHDSFRQFAVDRTATLVDGFDDGADRDWHVRAATVCSESGDGAVLAEELYHRAAAGQDDAVLSLATQAGFRAQFLELRSPELIRDDIALALRVAADRADVPSMLRLLLALVEVHERSRALDDVDVPGVLWSSGLTQEAIRYCGEHARRVPLAHAYGLAAALGQAGDQSGRSLFDAIDHEWRGERARTGTVDSGGDAAAAWVRAAVWYRPVATVLSAIDVVDGDQGTAWHRVRTRRRTAQAMREALIGGLDAAGRTEELAAVGRALAERADELAAAATADEAADDGRQNPPCDDTRREPVDSDDLADHDDDALADIIDSQIMASSALFARATDDDRHVIAQRLALGLLGRPVHLDAALDAADLLVAAGLDGDAARLLERLPLDDALTANALSYNGEPDAVEGRFRYWRLRHVFAAAAGAVVPPSTPPAAATPAGNGIDPQAPVHADATAIALATRIDGNVRTLAGIDARTQLSDPVPLHEAWSALIPMLEPFRSPSQRKASATYSGIERHRLPLLLIVLDVAVRHSPRLARLTADYLTSRTASDPDGWPAYIRAPLGRRLRDAGIAVDWYETTVAEQHEDADAQDVHGRLDALAGLVRVHASDGRLDAAQRIARSLPHAAFGVGYRKDYQFHEWVRWLGLALAGPGGEQYVSDAGWLARLLAAAAPRTEGAPALAAVQLPPAVARRDPSAAVRMFEFLIGHGTVSHPHALAALVASLLADATDPMSVPVAGDLIVDILAPASNIAHADAAEAFASAARRLLPPEAANALVEAVAERVARRALGTVRDQWRAALGVAPSFPEPPTTSSHDHGSLRKQDGAVIAKTDVLTLATSAAEVVALRQQEAEGSTFDWPTALGDAVFTPAQIVQVASAFGDRTSRSGQVLATLAQMALAAGDPAQALALARIALADCDPRGWTSNWDGGGRRRAAAVLARVGGREGRIEAARDLVAQAAETDWLAGMLLGDLSEVASALDPDTDFARTWPAVRDHLDGMGASIDLPSGDPLTGQGPLWWAPGDAAAPDSDGGGPVGPDSALAELAVRHLTHPTWTVREGAVRAVSRALFSRHQGAAAALVRLAAGPHGCPEDVLEAAGRALMGARRLGLAGPDGALLDPALNAAPTAVLRDLAAEPSGRARPLSALYRIVVPPSDPDLLGAAEPFLHPHVQQYELLADFLGLEVDSVLAAAGRYVSQVLGSYPTDHQIRQALSAANMQMSFPSPDVWASRAAFGRVLADLQDAGMLTGLPPSVGRLLRTVDPDLLTAQPVGRPAQVPRPPPAGHDQRPHRWAASMEGRVEQYLGQATEGGWVLLAGTSRLTVLNWDLLEEDVTWTTAPPMDGHGSGTATVRGLLLRDIGERQPAGRPARPGRALFVRNDGWVLHQWAADWVALRPDVASSLGWMPDPAVPGRWRTREGTVAVDRAWWVDGWWGRWERAFDDTAAEGHAVLASPAGLAALLDAFGPLELRVTVMRDSHRGDGGRTTAEGARRLDRPDSDRR